MMRSNLRGRHMKYFEGVLGLSEPHYELLLFLFLLFQRLLRFYIVIVK
jgi:hypothetical protein